MPKPDAVTATLQSSVDGKKSYAVMKEKDGVIFGVEKGASHASNDFIVVEKMGYNRIAADESMKNCELISYYLLVDDPEEDIYTLRRMQKGKPLNIFPKAEFLRYVEPTYFLETPQRRAMIRYLRTLVSSLPRSVEDYCNFTQSMIAIDAPPQEILNFMSEEGLATKPKWDLELFCKQFQNLNNTTFKHANRGYTPEEMLAQSKQGQN